MDHWSRLDRGILKTAAISDAAGTRIRLRRTNVRYFLTRADGHAAIANSAALENCQDRQSHARSFWRDKS